MESARRLYLENYPRDFMVFVCTSKKGRTYPIMTSNVAIAMSLELYSKFFDSSLRKQIIDSIEKILKSTPFFFIIAVDPEAFRPGFRMLRDVTLKIGHGYRALVRWETDGKGIPMTPAVLMTRDDIPYKIGDPENKLLGGTIMFFDILDREDPVLGTRVSLVGFYKTFHRHHTEIFYDEESGDPLVEVLLGPYVDKTDNYKPVYTPYTRFKKRIGIIIESGKDYRVKKGDDPLDVLSRWFQKY